MKNVLHVMLLLLCSTVLIQSVWAQNNVKVTGRVTDDTNQPLPGVNVVVSGTTNGTITDFDGNYSFSAPQGSELTFSFIGYVAQSQNVGNGGTINVSLQPESREVDEVVVVGYGTMKKSDLSGASVSVGEEAIKGSVITNLDQSLQGRAAGVQSVNNSGAPGSSSSIRVRGQATINANAEPLYVIDGVIVQSQGQSGADYGLGDALGNGSVSTISPLSTINPADIVSMEILKDASATAIYGAQGANGVVLITTKRGKAGDAKFTYDGMVAWSKQMKKLDIMDLREFAEYLNDLGKSGEGSFTEESSYYSNPSILGKGTNWQDAIFRTAFQHQHQLSAQGGSEKVQYYVSGGFMNQEGTIIGSKFKRLSLRSNLDAQLNKWLKLGLTAMYSFTKERLLKADQDEGVIMYSLTTPPDIPIYNIDGSYSSVSKEGFTNPNPIALALLEDNLLDRTKLNGAIFAEVKPIERLVWHTEFGFDWGTSRAQHYEPMVSLGTWTRASNEASNQRNNNTFWMSKNYITWNDVIADVHNYTVMIGHEAWESKYDYISVMNTGLESDEIHNPALGTNDPSIGNGFGSSSMVSMFGRLTYSYDNRYNLTYTYRRDGSSNFGPDKRWAGFHAAAASWRASNESFWENLPTSEIWTNAKVRVGWGQTGNSSIGGYKWGASMSKMETGFGVGQRPTNIPNSSVKWETQEQWNFGLDLGFLHEKVTLTVDLYKKTSEDMLAQLQMPSYMGTRGNGSSALAAPYGNYGTIENKGLEITLGVHPFEGEFSWDSEFQISFNRNKLKEYDGPAIEGYGQWSDVVSRSTVGESLYNFYGYKCNGVYKDYDDIINSPLDKTVNHRVGQQTDQDVNKDGVVDSKDRLYPNVYQNTWVGDQKYVDVNGDKVIDENDKVNIGSPMPKFTFGWTNTFRYKGFDLTLFFNGSYGNKIFNYLNMKTTHMNSAWTNQQTSVNDRTRLEAIDPNKDYSNGVDVYGDGSYIAWVWYQDVTNVRVVNGGGKLPRATINDPNDNDRISDRYIEDGSYLRLKNLTLGYTLPKDLVSKIGLENVRAYVNIQNVFTITKYTGYDPEIGASSASANVYGLDNGRYPSPSTCSFGLNITW